MLVLLAALGKSAFVNVFNPVFGAGGAPGGAAKANDANKQIKMVNNFFIFLPHEC